MLITVNSENAKILRRKCQPYIFAACNLDPPQSNLQKIADELVRVKQEQHSDGVAAPQIGELVRVFVISRGGIDLVIVNPRIMHRKGAYSNLESCLSLPGRIFIVKRSLKLTLTGVTTDGKILHMKLESPLSSVVEHEYDHLDGIMIDKKGKEVGANKFNSIAKKRETEAYPHLSYGESYGAKTQC